MKRCNCGGWQFYTVAELDGRQRVVLKCMACKKTVPAEREDLEDGA